MKKQILVLSISLVLAPMAMAEGAQQEGRPRQAQANGQRQADESRHCLRHTGSRIHTMRTVRQRRNGPNIGKNHCAMSSGRAYGREDIERTGAFDLRDALRRLDPAIH